MDHDAVNRIMKNAFKYRAEAIFSSNSAFRVSRVVGPSSITCNPENNASTICTGRVQGLSFDEYTKVSFISLQPALIPLRNTTLLGRPLQLHRIHGSKLQSASVLKTWKSDFKSITKLGYLRRWRNALIKWKWIHASLRRFPPTITYRSKLQQIISLKSISMLTWIRCSNNCKLGPFLNKWKLILHYLVIKLLGTVP